jgi:hypothetical protein
MILKPPCRLIYIRIRINDSANIKFRVLDVVYYDDELTNMYDCEFKVNMKTKSLDTTGIMKANISKDLKK